MSENSLNILLNGNIVKGYPGETILELARRHGIEIPTLCNDDRLEPFTSCYVCVVEVEGMRGHQPSCSTKLTEGMKIVTDNERIRKSRKMALELMLSNHYADCLGPCKQTCPAGVDVQGYISLIEKGLYHDAVALIKETNPLPAICGRVCVRPCEAACRRNHLGEGSPVGIDYLKRFAADYDLLSEHRYTPAVKSSTGMKVAVIGAGPGGLSAAWFLQIEGHQVDIFEAAPLPGGWLRYGIPEYRLPNDILDREVKNITDLGVKIHYRQRLGENLSYSRIRQEYDATVLTIGSQKGTGVGCEGDDAVNVFSGIDFLKNMEMTGQRYDFRGKTIAVVGGGNTAMDCCRTSIRCHADKVYVIYRRTEKEMPANPIEIHESKIEGVEYMFLTLPKTIHKNESGEVKSVTCIRMELGEPDASGRRRPVPVEGSDFDIPVDYVLAAIGQKTDVNFIDDINAHAGEGQLKINKWGDIDCDRATLRTGIPQVFAAGDGVTGPATIIEAIAQARIAATSVHQYLTGQPVAPAVKPFTSRRDNFRNLLPEDFLGKFEKQLREEMPVLPAEHRMNFDEVELGYAGEQVALRETQRCFECGCTAFFDCDLQKYSTQYQAEQSRFGGEFREYPVDFRHPFIEIDNNKCILCARCVRICREVAGANALGLVNRGFDTYVAPAMGNKLSDTHCESCGLCISTCPTGAITENVPFKPGPVRTTPVETICHYCSVGCAVTLRNKNGFVMGAEGRGGIVNTDGNICRFPRFGYRSMNDPHRVLQPLKRVDGRFEPVSFEEAFRLIGERIRESKPDENAFFAGARLSNEEIYLIHKLARAAAGTNNVGSFHYLARGEGYRQNCDFNTPLSQVADASLIMLFGTDINRDHGVAGFMVQNARHRRHVPVVLVTEKEHSAMSHKVDREIRVRSLYAFARALNYSVLARGIENALFLRDRVGGVESYRTALLGHSYQALLDEAGVDAATVVSLADQYNLANNAILIFSEADLSGASCTELFNLAIITGKLGKTASGVIALKEKNNAQGLFDMGASPHYGIAGQPLADPAYRTRLEEKWKGARLAPPDAECLHGRLESGSVKNLFIFGEDPVGCSIDPATIDRLLGKREFLVVQDYTLTDTALMADLVLPATFPAETGGSFTSAGKVIQEFRAAMKPVVKLDNLQQIAGIIGELGMHTPVQPAELFMELIALLPERNNGQSYHLKYTEKENRHRLFSFGCDSVLLQFEKEYEKQNAG